MEKVGCTRGGTRCERIRGGGTRGEGTRGGTQAVGVQDVWTTRVEDYNRWGPQELKRINSGTQKLEWHRK